MLANVSSCRPVSSSVRSEANGLQSTHKGRHTKVIVDPPVLFRHSPRNDSKDKRYKSRNPGDDGCDINIGLGLSHG